MSDDVLIADPQPPSAGKHRTADKVRFVLRGIGQTLITLGLVVLLFVVYEVWITNIFADQDQAQAQRTLKKVWDRGEDPTLALPGSKDSAIPLGTGIANIYLPRLGVDYHKTIVEGTDQNDLGRGPGHYRGTALPGQVGNFAIAGHRVGKGEPFLNMDKLRAGDAVILETKSYWFVYRVKGSEHGLDRRDADGIPGREIVAPSAGRVLLPVPDHRGKKPSERLMTMTTCHPKFTAEKRMIVFAKYQSKVAVQVVNGTRVDAMPSQITGLYQEVKP